MEKPTTGLRDHRAAVQAQKLRMELASQAIAHGNRTPSYKGPGMKILMFSIVLAAVALVGTIGVATVIGMIQSR